MQIKRKSLLAKVALFSATLIWGSSFFVMKNTLDDIPTFYLLAMRFSVATVILTFVFRKRLNLINKEYLVKGAVMGTFLFCAFVFQTLGLLGTTPGKNAFLTTVYSVIVPFLYWVYTKKQPDIYNILASVICLIGVGFVSLSQDFVIGVGDALTLVGGVFYALHIVAVACFSCDRDIFLLTIIQFTCSATLGWISGLLFNSFPENISSGSFVSLFYLCVFATTIALLLQNLGQKYTHASTAAIILSLESVFGVLFSIIFYHETLTLRIAVGFAFIFVAVVISETKLEFLRRSRLKKGRLFY